MIIRKYLMLSISKASEVTSRPKSLDQNLEELWTERRRLGNNL
jgi:hypothetical protein